MPRNNIRNHKKMSFIFVRSFFLLLIEALGATDASIFVLTAVTLYYGILMFDRGASAPGEIVLVILSSFIGGASIGQAFQQIDHFNFATSAASDLFPIIDRVGDVI